MSDNLTDPSRSTAQFRAFVEGADREAGRGRALGAPPARVAMIAAAVLAAIVIIVVVALAVA